MSPTKTSDKTIIRVKDLAEQPVRRYLLLPGGLDRVIISCGAINVVEKCVIAYATLEDAYANENILFSAPVSSGFVVLDRSICDLETVESGLRRMADDEKDAERLHEEIYGKGHTHEKTADGKVIHMRKPSPDFEPTAAPDKTPPTGQYL